MAKTSELAVDSVQDSDLAILSVDLEEIRDLIRTNLAGGAIGAFDLPRIRVPSSESKHWTIPGPEGDETTVKELEGIIVFFRDIRSWWPDQDPSGKPPVCGSQNGVKGVGTRWEGDDVGSHLCAECKWASFGTDPKGGRGAYCKEKKLIFLLLQNQFLPSVLFLPATSLQAFKDYAIKLTATFLSIRGVITKFRLVPDKNADGQAFNRVHLYKDKEKQLTKDQRVKLMAYADALEPSLNQFRAADVNTEN